MKKITGICIAFLVLFFNIKNNNAQILHPAVHLNSNQQQSDLLSETKTQHQEFLKTKYPANPNTASVTCVYDSIRDSTWNTLSLVWSYSKHFYTYNAGSFQLTDLNKTWNSTLLLWMNYSKDSNTYDLSNKKIRMLHQIWDSAMRPQAFENIEQHLYSYDVNNNLTSDTTQTWNGSAWDNSMMHHYMYDANNNLTSDTVKNWSGAVWVNSFQKNFMYDVHNNDTSELSQNWNGGAWVNYQQKQSIYDVNNNLTSSKSKNWNSYFWENSEWDSITYNGINKPLNYLVKTWNGAAWAISFQHLYSYDQFNNLSRDLMQHWTGIWVNSSQSIIDYNSNNILSYEIDQNYDEISSIFVNSKQITAVFCSNDICLKSYVSQYWSGGAVGSWSSNDSTEYFGCAVAAGIAVVSDKITSISIYPNPFTLQTTLSISKELKSASVKIIDVLGKEVKNIAFTGNQLIIRKDELPAGIYFMQIISEGEVIAKKKMIIQ